MMFVEGAFADGDLPQAVASALGSAWRFAHFSESRWLTVGNSCRTMLVAFLTGIAGLVKLIKKESTSFWYLRGFDRLDVRRLEFLVTCGVVSRLPELLQVGLMKDNRVAQTADSLWEAAARMMKWVVDLPESTYALLGELCQRPGSAMKDICINAAHISFHFFYRRVLVPAGQLP